LTIKGFDGLLKLDVELNGYRLKIQLKAILSAVRRLIRSMEKNFAPLAEQAYYHRQSGPITFTWRKTLAV
jgi:hypothetical protein